MLRLRLMMCVASLTNRIHGTAEPTAAEALETNGFVAVPCQRLGCPWLPSVGIAQLDGMACGDEIFCIDEKAFRGDVHRGGHRRARGEDVHPRVGG